MRAILSLYIILYSFFSTASNCGGQERWDIKTLTDKDVKTVNFTPKPATVSMMVKLKTFVAKRSTPRQNVEKQVYRVRAIVKDYFKEADGDIHVVLQDINNPNITMIAELPDPNCDRVSSSLYEPQFVKSKNFFIGNVQKGKVYTFVGVAFCDIAHPTPQRGVATK
jgi:hypothetical protein